MMTGYLIEIAGLSAYRAADRLRREGITILSAKISSKNQVEIVVNANERKKAFAILQGSCYNIKESRPLGLMAVLEKCVRAAGLLLGAVLALLTVLAMQGRVLKVEVTGSGAYLEPEIRAILSDSGVGYFSPMPRADSVIPAVLSLPRVHFCSVKGEGGILTVDVEVGEEAEPLRPESLFSPAGGRVEELIILRGTPLVQVGDSVEAGQELVANYALHGETKEDCIVIAFVRVSFPVAREYPLGEEQAKSQAFLDFGELTDIHMTQTEEGWLVEGTGRAEGSMNFG